MNPAAIIVLHSSTVLATALNEKAQMSDRFEDMRTFVAVVEGGGFNAAVDRLGVVKSAVSRRIRDLEDRLGARLLDRTTRQIKLTEAGSAFYERARLLLLELEAAEAVASTGAQEAVGRLRIAAPVSLTTHCLAPVLCEFLDAHPRVELEVDTNDRIVDIVREGFDLAVRVSRLKDSSLIARRVATVRHVCCASPAYLDRYGRPNVPGDVRKHRGIVYSNVDPRAYWTFKGDESVVAEGRLAFNNGDAVREAAVQGAGLVMLPTFIVYEAILKGELEVVLADFRREPIAMHVVHPSSRNVPAKVRLFIDFLVSRFGDEPFWDRALFGPDGLSDQAIPARFGRLPGPVA